LVHPFPSLLTRTAGFDPEHLGDLLDHVAGPNLLFEREWYHDLRLLMMVHIWGVA
jgi:hypothetical protein